jgi:dinuclear metal center YbgI/SA1388 family protein
MAVPRRELVAHLDTLLAIRSISADKSANGLQVEGRATVTHVAGAVDACQAVYDAAIAAGADLLFVHHGEFWGPGLRAVHGRHARRFATLLQHQLSLYAAHLPLDAHRELGHNACLARQLGLQDCRWYATYAGAEIGIHGQLPHPMSVDDLRAVLDRQLATRSTALPFGSPVLRRIGIISGAGAGALEESVSLGLDALVTGEYGHTDYHVARECGTNLIAAGHYATETPGIHAVLAALAAAFPVHTTFIDHPTGL